MRPPWVSEFLIKVGLIADLLGAGILGVPVLDQDCI
jgi:hypothetical protein